MIAVLCTIPVMALVALGLAALALHDMLTAFPDGDRQ